MFIDIHTHAFHPKVAEKVVRQLEEHYLIPPIGSGLIDDLLFAIFEKHPREKILFGSDYPLFDPLEELGRLEKRLHLSSSDRNALPTNAAPLLGLS